MLETRETGDTQNNAATTAGMVQNNSPGTFLLGFEYPQHFSKLFKNKTGMSPAVYRN
jgi:hypothetical protein